MDTNQKIYNAPKQVQDLWDLIQELIGPANQWPRWIWDLFWTRNVNHAQRPLLTAFIIFNGLDPKVKDFLHTLLCTC